MRIKSILLICALLLMCFQQTLYASTDNRNQPEDVDITLLKMLNVISPYSDGNYRLDEPVTREAMAAIALKMLNISADISDNDQYFYDVTDSHMAFNAVNVASKLNLFSGSGDGMFRPNELLTEAQAVKVLVTMLGYDIKIVGQDSFPVGYLSVAGNIGLLKGINIKHDQPITRGTLSQLLLNSLEIDVLKPITYGSEMTELTSQKGDNILSLYFNIRHKTGRVLAIPNTRLSSDETLQDGLIEIDGTVFHCSTAVDEEWLGKYVECYYKDDSEEPYEVWYIKDRVRGNEQEIVEFSDIISFNRETLSYYNAEGKTLKANVLEAADYIYNGKAIIGIDINELKDANGWLRLLDSDGDGIFDTVFVNQYYNIIAGSYSAAEKRILLKDSVDVMELDGYRYVQFVEGELVLENVTISSGDVLSVFESREGSSSPAVKLVVGEGAVRGTITSKSDSAIEIGGREYKAAKEVDLGEFSVNSEGVYYINFRGEVVGKDIVYKENKLYGLLLGASSKNAFDGLQIKTLTRTGVKVYKTAKKFSIDGVKNPTDALDRLKNILQGQRGDNRVMSLDLNSDGLIYNITTAFAMNNKTPLGASIRYVSDTMRFDNFFIDSKTVIFADSENKEESDEERYAVWTAANLSSGYFHTVCAYEIGQDYVAPVIFIVGKSSRPIDLDTVPSLVSKVSTVEVGGEIKTKVELITLGAKQEYFLANEKLSTVKKGDLIQFVLDQKNRIYDVETHFRLAETPAFGVADYVRALSNRPGAWDSRFRLVHGWISEKYGNVIAVKTSAESPPHLYNISAFRVACYDLTKGEAYIGTHNDVSLALSEGGSLVVYTRAGTARDIFVLHR